MLALLTNLLNDVAVSFSGKRTVQGFSMTSQQADVKSKATGRHHLEPP